MLGCPPVNVSDRRLVVRSTNSTSNRRKLDGCCSASPPAFCRPRELMHDTYHRLIRTASRTFSFLGSRAPRSGVGMMWARARCNPVKRPRSATVRACPACPTSLASTKAGELPVQARPHARAAQDRRHCARLGDAMPASEPSERVEGLVHHGAQALGVRGASDDLRPLSYGQGLIRGRFSMMPRGRPGARGGGLAARRISTPGGTSNATAMAPSVATRMFEAPRSISRT